MLELSTIAGAAFYSDDDFGLFHSQGRLCLFCSFQAFGDYALIERFLSSHKWLTL